MKTNPLCIKCGVELTDDNWYLSYREKRDYICKECRKEKARLYREENRDKVNTYARAWYENNPDKLKAIQTKYARKNGSLSMAENKECPLYLGVHVNEQLLSYIYTNVEVMPMNNPGYDFICGNGKKIDGKSSCLNKDGRWRFNIRHNTIADYFLLVAYDDRKDLNPIHSWLIPGHILNHLVMASISPSTIDKWSEYEQPLDKLTICCDKMRDE